MPISTGNKFKTLPSVKYHIELHYLFTPFESGFILHMLDVEFKKNHGYNMNSSKAHYLKVIGLSQYAFDKCICRMAQTGLLSKIKTGM